MDILKDIAELEIIKKLKKRSLRCQDLAGLKHSREDKSRYNTYYSMLKIMVGKRIVTEDRRGISIYYSLERGGRQ